MSKKLYIIAGEASGDLHGANVMKELLAQDSSLNIRFWGGDKMKAVGGVLAKHIRDLAFMGFVEVLKNLPTILKNFRVCKQDILDFKPDALLLIDYPGFNMRIAKWAKNQNIKVYYYISPTVWAWKENRVKAIRRDVFKLFCIFPFEVDFYRKHHYEIEYVGHPLLDEIEQYNQQPKQDLMLNSPTSKPIIALLPGSRKQELKTKLPVMLPLVDQFPQYQFVIAGAPNMERSLYNELIGGKPIEVVYNQTYALLQQAEAAVVTSGTATLETAMFEIPQVVCYIGNAISYQIAVRLVKVKYISIVNLILDKPAVVELIQQDCTTEKVSHELKQIIKGGNRREQILSDYKTLKIALGQGGASKKVAQSLLKTI